MEAGRDLTFNSASKSAITYRPGISFYQFRRGICRSWIAAGSDKGACGLRPVPLESANESNLAQNYQTHVDI
jgi:hypothetical protein